MAAAPWMAAATSSEAASSPGGGHWEELNVAGDVEAGIVEPHRPPASASLPGSTVPSLATFALDIHY